MDLQNKVLFIDPASISTGWALFEDGEYRMSGTLVAPKNKPIFKRLAFLRSQYLVVGGLASRAHIEQLVRNTHIYTHWAVGVIGASLSYAGCEVSADISIRSWQKYCDWNGKKKLLVPYLSIVRSEDELAAIGMGLYYYAKA